MDEDIELMQSAVKDMEAALVLWAQDTAVTFAVTTVAYNGLAKAIGESIIKGIAEGLEEHAHSIEMTYLDHAHGTRNKIIFAVAVLLLLMVIVL